MCRVQMNVNVKTHHTMWFHFKGLVLARDRKKIYEKGKSLMDSVGTTYTDCFWCVLCKNESGWHYYNNKAMCYHCIVYVILISTFQQYMLYIVIK